MGRVRGKRRGLWRGGAFGEGWGLQGSGRVGLKYATRLL